MAKKKRTSKDIKSDSTITRMQELGSAWIFKRAIQENATWQDSKAILKDPKTINEIKKIWSVVGKVDWDDEVDKDWLESFYKQQKVLLSKIGQPKFTLFTRDGKDSERRKFSWQFEKGARKTFMEWIEEYIGREFKIGNKDSWNPADIWLIQNEDHWKEVIKKATKTPRRTKGSMKAQLQQFNQILRALFVNRQIMGISLKKIGNYPADYKEINVSQKYFKTIETASMRLSGVKCYLGTKRINMKIDKNKKSDTFGEWIVDETKEKRAIEKGLGTTGYPTLETQDSWLFVRDDNNDVDYKIQIKNNSTSGMDNLKFEPTEEGKGAARMGKATREFVFDLMEAYSIANLFPKTHQRYPSTKAKFQRTEKNKVGKQIKHITTKCSQLGIKSINTNDDGKAENKKSLDWGSIDLPAVKGPINIAETMGRRNERWTANSKLQQISFINAVLSQSKEEINAFCTDLVYLAAKQGRTGGFYGTGYGPFGKIY